MRLGRRLRLASCVAVCATWLAATALAVGEAPSLLLVSGESPLGSRIGAELEAQGFRVLKFEPPSAELPEDQLVLDTEEARLLQAAQQAHASALVRVSADGAEVWHIEPTQAGARRELLRIEPAAAGDAERVLAARVAELLRTSGLDLAPAVDPPRSTSSETTAPGHVERPTTPAAPDAPVAPVPRALSGALLIDVDMGMSTGMDGLGAAPLFGASIFWQPARLAAFGLAATVPLSAPELSAAEGRARVQSWSLAAGPRLYPLGAKAALEPFFGLGLGVLWFRVEGKRAASMLELATEQLVVAGPHLALGVRWHALGRFSLTARIEGTYAVAKPVVEFADREIATLGRPFALCTVGIEFRAAGSGSDD